MDGSSVSLRSILCLGLLVLSISLLVVGGGCASQPEVIVVTATPAPTSTPVPPPSVTVCASGCDFRSIQAAIDDELTVPESIITLGDEVHTEADIDVTKSVIIQGHGATSTVVQASAAPEESTGRVFLIAEGASVTIRKLTIRHGNPDLEPSVFGIRRNGGAIANMGTLVVEDCIIRDNVANGGAGIMNRGELTVSNCLITDNYADGVDAPGHGCGSGAAIRSVEGPTTVVNSTLSSNSGVGRGGALHIACASTAVMTNCTLSGNSAEYRGGAAHVRGSLELVNCTVYGNTAGGRGRLDSIDLHPGGGIYVGGVFHSTNSIIAGSSGGADCSVSEDGQLGVMRGNLIEDGSCGAFLSGDPMLAELADNGGDTHTHALMLGSPGIDVVGVEECDLAVDQRGEPRPQGVGCDIGAFEVVQE